MPLAARAQPHPALGPAFSVRTCIAVAVLTGLGGLILMQAVPAPVTTEATSEFNARLRATQQLQQACGKQANLLECARRRPELKALAIVACGNSGRRCH
jgi:hypothetical protein